MHLLTQMLNDAGVATEVCTDPTTSVCMNLNQLTDWLLESAHGPIRITGMINIKVELMVVFASSKLLCEMSSNRVRVKTA